MAVLIARLKTASELKSTAFGKEFQALTTKFLLLLSPSAVGYMVKIIAYTLNENDCCVFLCQYVK